MSKKILDQWKRRDGFSFLEIIIVLAIAISIVIVVGNLNTNINVLNGLVGQELQSKSNINQSLQIMTTDIRSAAPAANGAFAIDTAGTSTFIFYTNTGGSDTERVRYFLSSSTIYRGVTSPTGNPPVYNTSTEAITQMVGDVTLATGTPLFSYYDSSYTGTQSAMTSTADVSDIRLAQISFYSTAANTTSTADAAPEYFSTLVDIRSLRSN